MEVASPPRRGPRAARGTGGNALPNRTPSRAFGRSARRLARAGQAFTDSSPPAVPRRRARPVLSRDLARGAVAPPRHQLWVERAAMYTHGNVHVSFADKGEARTYT